MIVCLQMKSVGVGRNNRKIRVEGEDCEDWMCVDMGEPNHSYTKFVRRGLCREGIAYSSTSIMAENKGWVGGLIIIIHCAKINLHKLVLASCIPQPSFPTLQYAGYEGDLRS